MKKILITGATGTLGKALVPLLGQNYKLRLFSRKSRPKNLDSSVDWVQGELSAGTNIPLALNEIDIVVHAATSPSKHSRAVDRDGTRLLVDQALKQNVSHFVYPSIVGIDDIPLRYYQHKKSAEEYIASADIPHTILRTTQFHTLIDSGLTYFNKLPLVMLLPRYFKFQSIDPSEVAQRLASIIGGGAAGRLPGFAGPHIQSFDEMARQWFESRGEENKKCINLPIPGEIARAFREGKNTCRTCQSASTSWGEWLTLQYAKKRYENA